MSTKPEINKRGNEIYRDGEADRKIGVPTFFEGCRMLGGPEDRYVYDFEWLTTAKGWKQFDTRQDAWYFGVWVHVEKRWTFTFAEGDRTLVVCPTVESFRAELEDAERFYGAPPPAFVAIDQDGKVTEYYDTRPTADDKQEVQREGN